MCSNQKTPCKENGGCLWFIDTWLLLLICFHSLLCFFHTHSLLLTPSLRPSLPISYSAFKHMNSNPYNSTIYYYELVTRINNVQKDVFALKEMVIKLKSIKYTKHNQATKA